MRDRPLRLNPGAGGTSLPGYTPVDRKTGGFVCPLTAGRDVAADEADPPPWCLPGGGIADNSVEAIYASHVPEHFSHRLTPAVLREWVRAPAPGGILKAAVPDYDYIHDAYANGTPTPHPIEWYLFGGHVDEDDRHGAMFNRRKLEGLMREAGLDEIEPWVGEINDCASLPVSLNLRGTKKGREGDAAAPSRPPP